MAKKVPSQPPANRLPLPPAGFDAEEIAVLGDLAQAHGVKFWDFLAAFFEKLPQGVILADQTGRVVVFNRAAAEILGCRPEEVIGLYHLWEFCADPDPAWRAGLAAGKTFADEEIEMQGGSSRKGVFKARLCGLYAQDGGLVGAAAYLDSLAEIRAVEREQRTMSRKVSIAKIVSALAHEINNPLQTVRTSLELGFDSRKTHQRRTGYLKVANHEISRIAHIITVLRRFYPVDGNEKLSADVNFAVRAAFGLLDKEIKQKEVLVELDLADSLPPVRLLDYQLQNILVTLLQDILDTITPGSTLKIQTYTDSLDRALISITDVTAAVSPSKTKAPHHQADLEWNLGLSISREIITEHGGSLEVSDGPRVFLLSLPPV